MRSERHRRRIAHLARWFKTHWWCRCQYNNIATYRCYACGRRLSRRLRAELASIPAPGEPMAPNGA